VYIYEITGQACDQDIKQFNQVNQNVLYSIIIFSTYIDTETTTTTEPSIWWNSVWSPLDGTFSFLERAHCWKFALNLLKRAIWLSAAAADNGSRPETCDHRRQKTKQLSVREAVFRQISNIMVSPCRGYGVQSLNQTCIYRRCFAPSLWDRTRQYTSVSCLPNNSTLQQKVCAYRSTEPIVCGIIITNDRSKLSYYSIVFKNRKEGSKLLVSTIIYYWTKGEKSLR
jgi:hypothetical protein